MTEKLSQYAKYENRHRKATLDIVKFFRKIIKKTLPYHTTNALVEDLEKICDKVDLVQDENKRLRKQRSRSANKCITKGCDGIIDTDYCTKCLKDWAS